MWTVAPYCYLDVDSCTILLYFEEILVFTSFFIFFLAISGLTAINVYALRLVKLSVLTVFEQAGVKFV